MYLVSVNLLLFNRIALTVETKEKTYSPDNRPYRFPVVRERFFLLGFYSMQGFNGGVTGLSSHRLRLRRTVKKTQSAMRSKRVGLRRHRKKPHLNSIRDTVEISTSNVQKADAKIFWDTVRLARKTPSEWRTILLTGNITTRESEEAATQRMIPHRERYTPSTK